MKSMASTTPEICCVRTTMPPGFAPFGASCTCSDSAAVALPPLRISTAAASTYFILYCCPGFTWSRFCASGGNVERRHAALGPAERDGARFGVDLGDGDYRLGLLHHHGAVLDLGMSRERKAQKDCGDCCAFHFSSPFELHRQNRQEHPGPPWDQGPMARTCSRNRCGTGLRSRTRTSRRSRRIGSSR